MYIYIIIYTCYELDLINNSSSQKNLSISYLKNSSSEYLNRE